MPKNMPAENAAVSEPRSVPVCIAPITALPAIDAPSAAAEPAPKPDAQPPPVAYENTPTTASPMTSPIEM